MGNGSRQTIDFWRRSLLFYSILIAMCPLSSFGSIVTEIEQTEEGLLKGAIAKESSTEQIKKMRKLLMLQKKELSSSASKLKELSESLAGMNSKADQLDSQQRILRSSFTNKIKKLQLLTEKLHLEESRSPLERFWMNDIDVYHAAGKMFNRSLAESLQGVKQLHSQIAELSEIKTKLGLERSLAQQYVDQMQERIALLQHQESLLKKNTNSSYKAQLAQISNAVSNREKQKIVEYAGLTAESGNQKSAVSAIDKSMNESSDMSLSYKGQLALPVSGPIVSKFGRNYDAKLDLLTFNKGITIGSFPGTNVRVVASGKVVYVGPLQGYGKMVILEHPGQLFTLYGQLGKLSVENGVHLKTGDVVGQSDEGGQPLYFEIRQKNVAVNPLEWVQSKIVSLNAGETVQSKVK